MESFNSIFGLIGLISGIYIFYALFMMKTKGEINSSILLPKDVDPGKCKDKAAYIREAAPRMAVLGTLAVVYGVMDLCKVTGTPLLVVLVLFVAALIWFAVCTMKMNKKYF